MSIISIRNFSVNSNSISYVVRQAMKECGANDMQFAMFNFQFNSGRIPSESDFNSLVSMVRGVNEPLDRYLEYASLDKKELEKMRDTLSYFATERNTQMRDEVRFINSILLYAVGIDSLNLDELEKRKEYVESRIDSDSEFKYQFKSELARLDELMERKKPQDEMTIAELEAAMPGFVCVSIDQNGNRNMHRLERDEIVVGHRSNGTSVVKSNRVVMGRHYKLIRMLAENYGNLYRDFRVDEDDHTHTMEAIALSISIARHALSKALKLTPDNPSIENIDFKIKKLEESITSDGSIEDTVYWWLETFGISSLIN